MKLLAALTLGLLISGCTHTYAASTYDAYGTGYDTSYGESVTLVAGQAPLAAANGMTLYTFDNDVAGQSNCYGDCAVSWPPYEAADGAQVPGEGFSVVERTDGTHQWAKDGEPLYFWVGDTAPGDINGDGVGGVWHVAH